MRIAFPVLLFVAPWLHMPWNISSEWITSGSRCLNFLHQLSFNWINRGHSHYHASENNTAEWLSENGSSQIILGQIRLGLMSRQSPDIGDGWRISESFSWQYSALIYSHISFGIRVMRNERSRIQGLTTLLSIESRSQWNPDAFIGHQLCDKSIDFQISSIQLYHFIRRQCCCISGLLDSVYTIEIPAISTNKWVWITFSLLNVYDQVYVH